MQLIGANTVIYSMDKNNKPVAQASPGETIVFETIDAFGGQIRTEKDLFESADWATVNPASGPLEVLGAKPGDTLVVDILDIQVKSPGVMVTVPNMGALGHLVEKSQTKIVPIENGVIRFNEKINLPVEPMVGE